MAKITLEQMIENEIDPVCKLHFKRDFGDEMELIVENLKKFMVIDADRERCFLGPIGYKEYKKLQYPLIVEREAKIKKNSDEYYSGNKKVKYLLREIMDEYRTIMIELLIKMYNEGNHNNG